MTCVRSPLRQSADTSAHGDRPWVYFMIDCFFLVTQFFVITFHIKLDEGVLPQDQGAGSGKPVPEVLRKILDSSNCVRIHVAHVGNAPLYECMKQPCSLAQLEAALSRLKGSGRDCSVRLSYEPAVPYGDVLAVFNVCTRLDIKKCGLIPLRGADAL